jgi:hypothetical protein
MGPQAASARDIGELFREPALMVACVLLIVVSVAWVLITRMIVRELKDAARRGIPTPRIDIVRRPRDMWSYPP